MLAASDRELLAHSASGEHKACEALVARHQAAVFRFAIAISRDSSEAEDALQETFLAAWRGAASFRGEEARP